MPCVHFAFLWANILVLGFATCLCPLTLLKVGHFLCFFLRRFFSRFIRMKSSVLTKVRIAYKRKTIQKFKNLQISKYKYFFLGQVMVTCIYSNFLVTSFHGNVVHFKEHYYILRKNQICIRSFQFM